MTEKPRQRTFLDFTLRGLDELDRFPTPEARARAMDELSSETRGWELVKGIVICVLATAAVVVLVRVLVPRSLAGIVGPFVLKDLALLCGIATFVFVSRWLHRRGSARSLRVKLIAAGVPVCIECGYAMKGLSATSRCPECGAEMTAAARALLAPAG